MFSGKAWMIPEKVCRFLAKVCMFSGKI